MRKNWDFIGTRLLSRAAKDRLASPARKLGTIAIVTVHGTNDSAPSIDGEKWYQRGSAFSERLKENLTNIGLAAEIVPYLWSGKNSASAREAAARELVDVVKSAAQQYESVHLVGHSHGGNVANEAAVLLGWGTGRDESTCVSSVTTVGTPFLDIQHERWQRLAAPIFATLMWPAFLAASVAWSVLLVFVIITLLEGYVTNLPGVIMASGLATVALLGLWFGVYFARANLARVRRPRSRSATAAILAVWHPNDEAIAFLRNVEVIEIEAFPRWALFRGARKDAIPFAISVAVAPLFIGPSLYVAGYFFDVADWLRYGDAWFLQRFDWLGLVTWEFVLAAAVPITFLAAYLTYLLVVGLGIGSAIEFLFRGSLNRFIARVFRGIALGRDSDQRIGSVSSASHTFRTEEHIIAGEVADRMRTAAEGAANALLEKYRWTLFNVADEQATSLAALSQDAMTWSSLIHTTYFDQPEIAEVIAAHVGRREVERTAGQQ